MWRQSYVNGVICDNFAPGCGNATNKTQVIIRDTFDDLTLRTCSLT